MRIVRIAFVAMFALPMMAQAQTMPPGLPPGAAAMTPDQAKAAYQNLDPAQKHQVRQIAEQAKAQIAADPSLKEKIKAWIKAFRGQ
jgi:hypothetical protein